MQYPDFYKRVKHIFRGLIKHVNFRKLDGGLQDSIKAVMEIYKAYPDGLEEPKAVIMPESADMTAELKDLAIKVSIGLLKEDKWTPKRFFDGIGMAVKEMLEQQGIDEESILLQDFGGMEIIKVNPKQPRSAYGFKKS